jgi:hypothetical protein
MEKPPQINGFAGFIPSDNGNAALIVFNTDQGEQRLELPMSQLRYALVGLLQASVACEQRGNLQPPMNEVDPSRGVLLPVSEIHVLDTKGAHKRIALRVGTIDLSVMVPDREAAAAIASGLTD